MSRVVGLKTDLEDDHLNRRLVDFFEMNLNSKVIAQIVEASR